MPRPVARKSAPAAPIVSTQPGTGSKYEAPMHVGRTMTSGVCARFFVSVSSDRALEKVYVLGYEYSRSSRACVDIQSSNTTCDRQHSGEAERAMRRGAGARCNATKQHDQAREAE